MLAQVQHEFLDIEQDPRADHFVRLSCDGRRVCPVVAFPSGSIIHRTSRN